MTREEAIKNIKEHCYFANLIPRAKKALDMAIKALEQEPCGDCISRKAVDRIINKWLSYPDYELKDEIYDMTKKIHKLPSVTPQPKVGHWIFDEILDKHYYCSECKSMGVDYWDFCPNCGAKMQEVEE